MKHPLPTCLALAALAATPISCSKKEPAPQEKYDASLKTDDRTQFRHTARSHYNNREFADLEAMAADVRTRKSKFPDGTWKISHLYEALTCRDDEPESMWKLHETIHGDWDKAFPKSVTSRIAHADFLTSYAWHARTKKLAAEVTEEGWRLFGERLETARKMLDNAKSLTPVDPVWGSVRLTVALGQAVPKPEFLALFETAKAAEPTFFDYDLKLAHYLLPRWHGEPGDWENAAETEIARPGGLGHETYARIVQSQVSYYDNIFAQSAASWRKTRTGFEVMRDRYPGSTVNLNMFCRMSCLANDKKLANDLFTQIGGNYEQSCWRTRKEFDTAKARAGS